MIITEKCKDKLICLLQVWNYLYVLMKVLLKWTHKGSGTPIASKIMHFIVLFFFSLLEENMQKKIVPYKTKRFYENNIGLKFSSWHKKISIENCSINNATFILSLIKAKGQLFLVDCFPAKWSPKSYPKPGSMVSVV